MRKLHRAALSLAGLALTAGTALAAAPPAGAATTALVDFPPGFSEGTLVSINSGKCLEPSRDNLFGNGALIEQHTCNGSAAQNWDLVPLGTKSFIGPINGNGNGQPTLTHLAYHIVNAASGLCLDDRNGVSSNGATVQQWACNNNGTTMQWGGFEVAGRPDQSVICNVRASSNRQVQVALVVASGSTADNVPIQLYNVPNPPPAAQEWVYNQAS
jgi:hypothetical protein